MLKNIVTLCLAIAILFAAAVGCESLPGNKRTQGAVIGGAGGAAAGAVIAKDNRLLGALIGGALGAGGGYLIGANIEKADEEDREDAIRASREAEANPVTPEQVKDAVTADVNKNGYVTLDEVIAMKNASLSEDEMIRRLDLTDQIFELTAEQENRLRAAGISDRVINEMWRMNREGTIYATPKSDERISRDPNLVP